MGHTFQPSVQLLQATLHVGENELLGEHNHVGDHEHVCGRVPHDREHEHASEHEHVGGPRLLTNMNMLTM